MYIALAAQKHKTPGIQVSIKMYRALPWFGINMHREVHLNPFSYFANSQTLAVT